MVAELRFDNVAYLVLLKSAACVVVFRDHRAFCEAVALGELRKAGVLAVFVHKLFKARPALGVVGDGLKLCAKLLGLGLLFCLYLVGKLLGA